MSMSVRMGPSFFLAVPPVPSSHWLEYIRCKQIITDVEQNSGNYVPPVRMALVIVHYRQGKTEDAIFWFNAGRFRAQFDAVVSRLKGGQVA
jgi:hypothetical protein